MSTADKKVPGIVSGLLLPFVETEGGAAPSLVEAEGSAAPSRVETEGSAAPSLLWKKQKGFRISKRETPCGFGSHGQCPAIASQPGWACRHRPHPVSTARSSPHLQQVNK